MFKTFLSVDGTTGSPSSVYNRTHYRVFDTVLHITNDLQTFYEYDCKNVKPKT